MKVFVQVGGLVNAWMKYSRLHMIPLLLLINSNNFHKGRKRSIINILLKPLFQQTCGSESLYNTPESSDNTELGYIYVQRIIYFISPEFKYINA